MSLNGQQVARTRDELTRNLALAGLSADGVGAAAGIGLARARAALAVDGAPPEDVWLVRDLLDRTIRVAGGTPQPWSTLTEGARAAAQWWFPLVDLDDAVRDAAR